ncbi:MAG: septal ring lytic transglycosylase RlpA family protein [Pseudomonadota bacterium]
MKTTVARALFLALSTASMSAAGLAGLAAADRQGAPIVYAGQTPHDPSPELAQLNSPSQPNSIRVTENQRVVFQYPGAPVRDSASGPTTIASSAGSTVAPSPSKMILKPVVSEAMPAPKGVAAAPAVVAAATGTAQTVTQPIRIASVKAQQPVATGQPLTLSRVKINRAAQMTEERGRAGIYMDGFNGQPTANGEIFDETAMTAAHPSLPLPSLVQVVNEENGREVVVRVNDRGPFDGKRVLELSPRAGTVLGMSARGSANVKIRYLGPAPVKQTEDSFLAAQVESEALPPVTPVALPEPMLPVSDYSNPGLSPTPNPALDSAPKVEPVPVSMPVISANVFIQAGAFADIANAQSLTTALERGHSVKIEEARINGGDFFRVLIGPFPDRETAERYRAQLANAGIADGFLTIR